MGYFIWKQCVSEEIDTRVRRRSSNALRTSRVGRKQSAGTSEPSIIRRDGQGKYPVRIVVSKDPDT